LTELRLAVELTRVAVIRSTSAADVRDDTSTHDFPTLIRNGVALIFFHWTTTLTIAAIAAAIPPVGRRSCRIIDIEEESTTAN
jgi:hypothetical protein